MGGELRRATLRALPPIIAFITFRDVATWPKLPTRGITHRSLYRLPTYIVTLHYIFQPVLLLIFKVLSAKLLKAMPPNAATSFCQDRDLELLSPVHM